MVQKQSNGHLQNRLLAALSPKAFSLFESDLRTSTFKQGAIVQEVGEPVDQIYFPQTGMISLLVVTQEGVGIEAASIGREGAVGLHRGLGRRRSFTRAVVQVSGTISHISADVFERAVGQIDTIKDIITHYTEVLWVEAQQIAACNAVHSAEARFARWLLQTQDRIDSDSLPLTQDLLSQMLGVRRTTVTLVARALQQAGLIRYKRGHIVILDRAGLEEAACECYQIETLPEIIGVKLASPVCGLGTGDPPPRWPSYGGSMPRYYFHLSNKRCVTDPYGTVLLDKNAAMSHALVVARELMLNSTGILGQRWSAWTMLVMDKDGKNVLTLPFSEVPEGITRH